MKVCVLVLLCIAFCAPLYGQTSTTVSATVTDTSGQAWAQGSFEFDFKVSPANPTSQYFWGGTPFAVPHTITGNMDSSGHFSIAIPSNTNITPAQSTWVLTLCSLAQGNTQCYSTQGMTIQGTTQDLSSIHPPAITIDLAHPAYPFTLAYQHPEIVTAPLGGIYYDWTQSHYFLCTNVSPTGLQQWYGTCLTWKEFCLVGDGLCSGGGTSESFQHNGTLVGTQPTLNVIDTGTVVATLTNDTLNNRVNLQLAASSGTGCTVGALLDTWTVSIHPDHTCYGSTHWTWDDRTNEQNMQAGLTNTITNQQLSFLKGNNLSATSDVSGSMQDIFLTGDYMTASLTQGAISIVNDAVMIGGGAVVNGQQITASNGGAIVEVACFLRACEHSGGFHGIQATGSGGNQDTNINVIFSAGRFNDITAASLSNTSSIFALAESSHFTSAAGCNNSDNFTLGEFNTVACSTASTADVDDTVVLGQNHSVNSTTHNLGFAYILGNGDTITQSSGSNIGNDGLFGKSLSITNFSDCWLVGENGVCPNNNFVGVGLSSTPEIGVTSGTVNVTGALDLNGVRLAAILGTPTVCNLGSPITSIGAGTTQVVIACSTTAPSTGCPCRAFVSWNIEGNGTSSTEQAEGIVSDGTSSFAGTSSTMDNQITTGYKGMARSDYSPNLYTNGSSVTFTLRAASDHTWNIQTASFYLSAPTQVRVTYLTSN